MSAPIPPALAAHLREIGVVVLTTPKPASSRIDQSQGWFPSHPGEEAPF
jgi:hypothetical protein